MLEKLIDIAKVQSTEASNKIEDIVTISTRAQQICADKTTSRNRGEEEIMGYRDVLNTIHESYEYITICSSYILQSTEICTSIPSGASADVLRVPRLLQRITLMALRRCCSRLWC